MVCYFNRRFIESDAHHSFTSDLCARDRICVVADDISDTFCRTFAAWPERLYVITAKRLTHIGRIVYDNPPGHVPRETQQWLEDHYGL